MFPIWAQVLELGPAKLHPIDVPLNSSPSTYRDLLARLNADESFRGALVTSHKVRILQAARDMFTTVDAAGEILGEISCIAHREDGLHGSAKDPYTSGRAMSAFIPPDHFRESKAEVLCFGAGGSGMAIAMHLMTQRPLEDQPARMTIVNRSENRLKDCAVMLRELGIQDRVRLVANENPATNDELMAHSTPGTLVINATGMGKDTPGSPITDAAVFPEAGLAWELNYRGELDFLHQAERQKHRLTRVEDGWTYFIHGWSSVIAEVFDLSIDEEQLAQLDEAATAIRT